MKKEKHFIYRLVMAGLILMLLVGVALLVASLYIGPDSLYLPGRTTANGSNLF